MARRLLICLSFATFCFLNTWAELAQGQSLYYARYDPLSAVAWPVVCWEAALALALLSGWEWLRRWKTRPRVVHLAFLAACLAPLGIAAVAALRIFPFDIVPVVRHPLFWPAALIVGAAPVAFAMLRPASASRLMREIFLYSWPVLAIVLLQAGRNSLFKYPRAAYADGPPAAPVTAPPPRIRVVWILFDELSQELAFSARPATVELPNLDRLKAESFYASSAKSPSDATETSVPALTLGRLIEDGDPEGPRELRLEVDGLPDSLSWGHQKNVFDDARDLGFNTALAGWFHPYGRLLNRSLTRCYWTAGWLLTGVEEPFERVSLPEAMRNRARLQIATLPLAGHLPFFFPGLYHRQEKAKRFDYLLGRSLEIAADPALGLALIHLPVPHPPAIYSRSKHAIAPADRIGYLDSLALVDLTLGSLRSAIAKAGLENRTAILVSSDHGWRTRLWRGGPEWTAEEEAASHGETSGVPFLLHFARGNAPVVYDRSFNTVLTRALIVEILSGRLTDPGSVAEFIDSRR